MLQELEKTSVRKGLVQDCHDWSNISRDDIYRQRVFGTRTGADEFVVYDEQRRHSWSGLFCFVFFVISASNFVYDRVDITSTFHVNEALRVAVEEQIHDWEHEPNTLKNVRDTKDLRQWLLDYFPGMLVPMIQGRNKVIGDVRLTARRFRLVDSEDERFQALAPRLWDEQDGSGPISGHPGADATQPFGAYRSWGTNEAQSPVLGLRWCGGAAASACPAGSRWLGNLTAAAANNSTEAVVAACKRRCEDLGSTSGGPPCTCFTQANITCEFFSVDESNLQATSSADGVDCPTGSLAPQALQSSAGDTAYWPRMQAFTFTGAGQKDGSWMGQPGHVVFLKIQPQATLDELAAEAGRPAPSQAEVLRGQLYDWLDAGLLKQGTSMLVADFLVHNPHYQMYTWLSLIFESSPTGSIGHKLWLSSMKIPASEARATKADLVSECSFWDFLFIIMLSVYLFIEFIQIVQQGSAYFKSLGNCLTFVVLGFVVALCISRSSYLTKLQFTDELNKLHDGGVYINTFDAFEAQHTVFDHFRYLSGFCLFLLYVKLVRFLYDLIPRVSIVLNAVVCAITPIFLSVIIICMLLLAFSVFSNLMFGGAMLSFSSLGSALRTSTEFTIGTVNVYNELSRKFPAAGCIYFIVFIMVFFFMAQSLAKAMILCSYSDQAKLRDRQQQQHQQQQDQASTNRRERDWLGKAKENLQARKTTLKEKYGGRLLAHVQMTRPGPSYVESWLFVLYFVTAISMAFFMTHTGNSFDVADSMFNAIRGSTFSKLNPLSGNVTSGFTFDTISSREDVELYLQEALPKMLFETSDGDFNGTENPLKTYASALPEVFDQLVINDWNLLVGQNPVRISARYFKHTEVDSEEVVGNIVPLGTKLPQRDPRPSTIDSTGTAFDPPLEEATDLDQIEDSQVRDVLQRRCAEGTGLARSSFAYGSGEPSDARGFACLLSVNRTETTEILDDLAISKMVNDQLAVLAVDFVVYNGFAELFTYVAIVFKFQPSGVVDKDIFTVASKSDYYNFKWWYRILMEILFATLTCYFFGNSMRWLVKGIAQQCSHDKLKGTLTPGQRLVNAGRTVPALMFLDPWSTLELFSSVLNFITIGMWFDVVFAKVASPKDFFFPERPTAGSDTCISLWCRDDFIVGGFHTQGLKMRSFTRTIGIAQMCIVFRLMKYLQIYPRIQIMMLTFKNCVVDIFWITAVVLLLFAGFVATGTQFFGMWVASFQSNAYGVFACAELFLGTYDSTALAKMPALEYMLFTYSYIIFFRYILLNMFFAVIDEHFSEAAKNHKDRDSPGLNPFTKLLQLYRGEVKIKDLLIGGEIPTGLTNQWMAAATAPVAAAAPSTPRRALASATVASPRAGAVETPASGTTRLGLVAFGGVNVEALDDPEAEDTSPSRANLIAGSADDELQNKIMMRAKIWRWLPEKLQAWALEKSGELHRSIGKWYSLRKSCNLNPVKVEKVLEDVEVDMNEALDEVKSEVDVALNNLRENELRKLKEIHQDQESLAWYIMKREGELKKVEARLRNRKENRLTQQAASRQEGEDKIDT